MSRISKPRQFRSELRALPHPHSHAISRPRHEYPTFHHGRGISKHGIITARS